MRDERAFASFDQDGVLRTGARPDGIVVVVHDVRGRPCAGAIVEVERESREDEEWRGGKDRGTTDDRGVFRTSLRAVEHIERVTVTTAVLGPLVRADTFAQKTGPEPGVLLVVPDPAELAVEVVDAGGAPVCGATVRVAGDVVRGEPSSFPMAAADRDVLTDQEGIARCRVPAGCSQLRAWSDAHAFDHTLHCDLPTGPCRLRIELHARGLVRTVPVHVVLPVGIDREIQVRAEDSDLWPVPAQPFVRRIEVERRWPRVRQLGAGEFEIEFDAPFVNWHLDVGAEGCSRSAQWIAATEQQVTIVLARDDSNRPARIRGRVRGPDGEPVAAQLRVYECHDRSDIVSATADREGRYEIVRRAGPPVCILAWDGAYSPTLVGCVACGPGDVAQDIQLGRPGTVACRLVAADGEPVGGAVRLLRPTGALAKLDAAVPPFMGPFLNEDHSHRQDAGPFAFAMVGAEEHEVLAMGTGWRWPARARVRAGDAVELRSGDGMRGWAMVELDPVDPVTKAPLAGLDCEPPTIDRGGALRFAVPAGQRPIKVWGRGRVHHVEVHRLVEGRQRLTIEVPISLPRFVRLVDVDGRAIDAATIRVVDTARSTGTERVFRSLLAMRGGDAGQDEDVDANGRADLYGLPTGTVLLSIERWQWTSGGCKCADGNVRDFVLGPDDGVRRVAELRW